jgi:hypothetical protein
MRKKRMEILGLPTVEQYIAQCKIKNLPTRFETSDGGFISLAYMISEYAIMCNCFKEIDDEFIDMLTDKYKKT